MRAPLTCCLIAILLLAGCGLKGPLVLPNKKPSTPVAARFAPPSSLPTPTAPPTPTIVAPASAAAPALTRDPADDAPPPKR